jgi:S-phase kinase-associated protein 1
MIQDSGAGEKISLPSIKTVTLQRVISYCEHYQGLTPSEIPKPLPSNTLSGVIDKWDEEFIDIKDRQQLLDLVLAADYLEISELKKLCAARIAVSIKGKTTQEMREHLGIVNDYTV